MTYITKFSNVQITGNLNTSGDIETTGNVTANSEFLSNNITVGSLVIEGGTGNSTITGSDSLTIGATELTLGAASLDLGDVTTLHIQGNVANVGNAAIYLSSDGNGVLSWSVPQGQGNGVVGGTPTAVQFNNGAGFGGDTANFAYVADYANSGVPQLTINAPTVFGGGNGRINAANVNVSLAVANLSINGGSSGQILYTGGGGNVYFGNTPTGSPQGPNGAVQLNAGGNLLSGYANFSYVSDANAGVLTLGGLDIAGNGLVTIANASVAADLTLPTVANLKIPGGSNNYVLKTDGTGNLSFEVSTFYNVANVTTGTGFQPDTEVDDMVCVSFAGPVTITLPQASVANVGAYFVIKDTWGGNRVANPITITVNGGAQIDGQSSVDITGAYNSITVACTSSTAWGVI